jgi:hypothetical protein
VELELHKLGDYWQHFVGKLVYQFISRQRLFRMPSSGMLRRVALVRTDVTEERSASIISVTRIGRLDSIVFLRSEFRLLVTANVVPSLPTLITLMREALRSSEHRFLKNHTA